MIKQYKNFATVFSKYKCNDCSAKGRRGKGTQISTV